MLRKRIRRYYCSACDRFQLRMSRTKRHKSSCDKMGRTVYMRWVPWRKPKAAKGGE